MPPHRSPNRLRLTTYAVGQEVTVLDRVQHALRRVREVQGVRPAPVAVKQLVLDGLLLWLLDVRAGG